MKRRELQVKVIGSDDNATPLEKAEAYLLGKFIFENGFKLISPPKKRGISFEAFNGFTSNKGFGSLLGDANMHVDILFVVNDLSSPKALEEIALKLMSTEEELPIVVIGNGSLLIALINAYPGKIQGALSADNAMEIILSKIREKVALKDELAV